MENESTSNWSPDWSVPPGEILLEALEDRSMSQSELARRMGRPIKTINEIVRGKAAITPATAIQLELVLGISARTWNNLEAMYREHLAWNDLSADLASDSDWVGRFPLKDLESKGLLKRHGSVRDDALEILQFFEVGTPAAWKNNWATASALHRESATYQSSVESVASWLRWGEIETASQVVDDFDANVLISQLDRCKALSRSRPFSSVLTKLREALAHAGVLFIVLPEIEGAHISGAARWTRNGHPMIQLSLRHETDDHFWFTLYHEAGHLVSTKKRQNFVDLLDPESSDLVDEEEDRANSFARSALVDDEQYSQFVERGQFDSESIRSFAGSLNVAPGIVVGRLQRDDHIRWSQRNELKFRIKWV